ncbi:hypothetical protein B0H16DRAFT_1413132 [Mycena metata]|uniref:FAD-binding PCMH-type domain-containing protein n=1 Tax=Mycena metata TaxID=1033252 RepID=A0AAD7NKJ2_9AGAR|nr:hypothetical protein B0H16DRAFT_1413132 [Mycena metata]
MFPARVCLLSVLVLTVLAEIVDNAQVVLSFEKPGELPDLVEAGIWLEEDGPESSGVLCCGLLNHTFPSDVFFRDSAEYQSQQASYYSLEQADINPACRVSPTSAVNVAAIVARATRYGCAFAVRSGGHMISKGFSNIDASGFTIDLQRMNDVSVLEEGRLVSFDSGCRWYQVYSALKPYNLTTVGGRVPDVGVAGFLLGGGISVLSLAHGFGSSNIVNYQVVLADGTINDVNEKNLPDLYWALKYGSTNFGIVTRFDMTTYPLADVWGGSLIFDISQGPALLQAHVDFAAKLDSDPMGLNVIAFAWDPRQQTYIIWSPNIYLSDAAFPPLYSDIEALVPNALLNTMRITDLMSITNEFQATAPGTGRVQWFTLTLKTDAALLWDIHRKGVEIFEPYLNRTGFSPATIFQPLNRGFAAAGEKNGGNPSGILTEDGDLIVALGMALWDDRADDEILKEKVHEHWKWSERTARERGLLHPFIYMNYASSLQDVMGGLGAENLAKMRKIKDQYDPEDRFGRYWKGGFKL